MKSKRVTAPLQPHERLVDFVEGATILCHGPSERATAIGRGSLCKGSVLWVSANRSRSRTLPASLNDNL